MENKVFYDNAAEFYDQMIDFKKNFEARRNTFEKVFPKKCSAVDLGCGTGVDSLALSSLGFDVTAVDPSRNMIEKAKENAKALSLNINFVQSSILSISEIYNSKFGLVVSLGNTIANVEGATIYSATKSIYDLLVDGGKCLIHILNYQLITETNERIVSIKPDDKNFFVRFYDFINGQIFFNILRFDKEAPSDYSLISTQVFGYKKDLLVKVFDSVGFKNIQLFGNLNLKEFEVEKDKDLFLMCEK